ncbi:MAG: prolyl oligopeptidase family serine peptidase [Gemmatimonadales bacterium]
MGFGALDLGADGSGNRFLTKGKDARWSPDGTRLAYLDQADPKGRQIFARYVDAPGEATQVSRLEREPRDLRWSPDGKQIGFVMFVPTPVPWKIDLPEPPKDAKWTGEPKIVQSLHYRLDKEGLFKETGRLHLFVVASDGGTPRQVTRGEWDIGARFETLLDGAVNWDWSPDGRTMLVDGYDASDADLRQWLESNVYAVDVETGSARKLTPDGGRWATPAVSPDGRRIALTGFPDMRSSYRAADLYVMNADGTGMRPLVAGLDRDAEELAWAPDGSGVYFTAEDRGSRHLFFAPLTGPLRQLTTGPEVAELGSVAKRGVAAVVRSTPKEPPDVWRVTLGKRAAALGQLTHVNDDLLARVRVGDVEELWVTSSGATRVQGWVVKPPAFDPGGKYPLILEIHGGPHAMYDVRFRFSFQNFAANGYVVLYVNPRGSTGYGSAFGNAIQRAYPGVDYDDLMAAVDTVIGRGFVDQERMYVGGCSGGGVLSSWVIGHTDRFAAAAVRCPVTNWMSMAGQTDIPTFTYSWFEKPFWEAPEAWLRQSPLMYVANVKTSTVVMTGELDLRTPMPQSEEYYAALKLRGVPAALIRFEGEYHGTSSRPSNFMRTQLYMMSWYQRWSRTAATAAVRGR